jgi:hypothetical protein
MDFSWTEDQLTFRDTVVKFAQKELKDDLVEREKRGELGTRSSRRRWSRSWSRSA